MAWFDKILNKIFIKGNGNFVMQGSSIVMDYQPSHEIKIHITKKYITAIEFTIGSIGSGLSQINKLYAELEFYCTPPQRSEGLSMIEGLPIRAIYEISLCSEQKYYPIIPLTPNEDIGTWTLTNNEAELFGIYFNCNCGTAYCITLKAEIYNLRKEKIITVQSNPFVIYEPCGGNYDKWRDSLQEWIPFAQKSYPSNITPEYTALMYKFLIIRDFELEEFAKKISFMIVKKYENQIIELLNSNNFDILMRGITLNGVLGFEEGINKFPELLTPKKLGVVPGMVHIIEKMCNVLIYFPKDNEVALSVALSIINVLNNDNLLLSILQRDYKKIKTHFSI